MENSSFPLLLCYVLKEKIEIFVEEELNSNDLVPPPMTTFMWTGARRGTTEGRLWLVVTRKNCSLVLSVWIETFCVFECGKVADDCMANG